MTHAVDRTLQYESTPANPNRRRLRAGVWRARATSAQCCVMAVVIAALAAFCPPAPGLPAAQGAPLEEGRKVVVGMYLRDVPDVDLRAGTYSFDAYLWFRWDPSQFQAIGGGDGVAATLPRAPVDCYELVGVNEVEATVVGSRPGYAAVRVQGSVEQAFDLSRFPLDDHVLRLRVEDAENEIHLVRYVPDVEGSTNGPISLQGWRVAHLTTEQGEVRFDTNFGDLELPTHVSSVYSVATFTIEIFHDGFAYFIKLTSAAMIATALALVALAICPSGFMDRFSLPIGALFTTVGSEWVVSSALPDRSGLTLADAIHLVSFVAIFLVVVVSVFSLRAFEGGRQEDSRRIDRTAARLLVPGYVLACALVVWLR